MLRRSSTVADRAEPIGGINTTPLIDVLLVLLVMFIITIPIQLHEIPLPLPQPGPVAADQQIPHLLAIARNGTVTLDSVAVQSATLAAMLKALQDDPRAELQIKTDPEARYNDFAQTLAVAKRSGITRIGFVGNTLLQ